MSPPAAGTGVADRGLVVLLHGLGRTYRSMWFLESEIERAGYRVFNWDYPGRGHSLDELVAMLRRTLEEMAPPETQDQASAVHFVTHSLGGILVRGALRPPAPLRAGRVVMIAPPNHGVRVTGGLGGSRFLVWLYGRSILDLAGHEPDLRRLGVPEAEIGIIAGDRRFHLFNPNSYFNVLANRSVRHDGTVEVERTKLPGMKDFIVVPAHHTFICGKLEVARQTLAFLEDGAFEHGGNTASGDGAS